MRHRGQFRFRCGGSYPLTSIVDFASLYMRAGREENVLVHGNEDTRGQSDTYCGEAARPNELRPLAQTNRTGPLPVLWVLLGPALDGRPGTGKDRFRVRGQLRRRVKWPLSYALGVHVKTKSQPHRKM